MTSSETVMVADEEGVIERIIIFMMPPEKNEKGGKWSIWGGGGLEVVRYGARWHRPASIVQKR